MPAHIKSVLIGPSLSVPITDGRLALGTRQGIYLCEHRDQGGTRRLVATTGNKGSAVSRYEFRVAKIRKTTAPVRRVVLLFEPRNAFVLRYCDIHCRNSRRSSAVA